MKFVRGEPGESQSLCSKCHLSTIFHFFYYSYNSQSKAGEIPTTHQVILKDQGVYYKIILFKNSITG